MRKIPLFACAVVVLLQSAAMGWHTRSSHMPTRGPASWCDEDFWYSFYFSVYASGQVLVDGLPVSGAEVRMTVDYSSSVSTNTDANGYYSLPHSYSKSGYISCPFNSISFPIEVCAWAPGSLGTCHSQYFSTTVDSPSDSDSTSVWENFYLTSVAPAPSPKNLVAEATGASRIQLRWESGGGTTSGYLISHQKGSVAPSSCAAGASTTKRTFVVEYLEPSTTYSFRVCAVNAAGTVSVDGAVTSSQTGVAQYNTSLRVIRLASDFARIEVSRDASGLEDMVTLQVCRQGTTSCSSVNRTFGAGTASFVTKLRNLKKRRTYVVTAIPVLGNRSQITFTLSR